MSISRIAPCAAAQSSLAWSAVREKFFHSIAAAPENERLVCPDQIPLVGKTSRWCSLWAARAVFVMISRPKGSKILKIRVS
jgi:hypothetical protein